MLKKFNSYDFSSRHFVSLLISIKLILDIPRAKKDTTPTKLNSESLSTHVLLNQYVLDFSLQVNMPEKNAHVFYYHIWLELINL